MKNPGFTIKTVTVSHRPPRTRAAGNNNRRNEQEPLIVEGKPIPPDTRIVDGVMQHKYQGHVHRRTQYDPRNPAPPPYGNPLYTSSNWAYGARATTVHPTSGQHTYDTGNLYRTVHWRDEGFGLNGYFTDDLNRAGMWRHEGLNCAPTKSRTMANPSQWGTPAQGMSTI